MVARAGRPAVLGVIALQALWLAAAAPDLAHAQLPNGAGSVAPMIDRVSPAVVNIAISKTISPASRFSEELLGPLAPMVPELERELDDRTVQSSGSGVIFDARNGYIVSNHHVVDDADSLLVTLHDGRFYDAEVLGSDVASDIAVLKIDAPNLSQIEFGDAAAVRVGDFVLAIGNPFGLSHSVTSGIVSGIGRTNIVPPGANPAGAYRDQAYENFIQTDASINPGNSGGALVGLDGALIGINSAILSRTGGNIGIGFAIPVDMARSVMTQLVETGRVARGALGISTTDVTPQVARERQLATVHGALITFIGGVSPARAAGLAVDDVIVAVNERPIRASASLRNAIGMLRPGDTALVEFSRAGQRRRTEITLGEADETLGALERELRRPLLTGVPRALLGPSAGSLIEGLSVIATEPGFDESGLLVSGVRRESVAGRAGFMLGDVITHINDQRVTDIDTATGLMNGGAEPLVFKLFRDGVELSITVP